MDNQSLVIATLELLGTIFTVIGAVIGYILRYKYDSRKERNIRNTEVKREMYGRFVSMIIDLFKKGEDFDPENTIHPEFIDGLYEFYKDYILYSSPKVINAFGDFMQYTYKHPENSDAKITLGMLANVIKEMRSELGLSNKDLGTNGERIFKAILEDYHKIET